ncbi:carboxylesterase/lipase family protein [Candidatus Magnetominusculus xianensis]|uniref:Carboxylic ester hydrolase n=1 Tax=Candidatus Magnetominusculus xianensis TaxID=1748249 RepID=A0ABR5SK25_9BACT|nr:carboxylesterase family protein [Candidatus Magnetominusculus xianensis]KWT93340.1 putative cAMP-regulated D2 protein-like protein [Candidatus Magnetominusculus xianensis]MBF0402318.1 carboxylesterase family protein [Nitrospirota bacterium]
MKTKVQCLSNTAMKTSLMIAIMLAAITLLFSQGIAATSCSQGVVVSTVQGTICGNSSASGTTAYSYKGIPFAESTAGSNRWAAPVQKQTWNGTFAATEFGPYCPQSGQTNISEDCLSLNVWTPVSPSASGSLPVMVFIYGGAFIFGGSASPLYDGAYIASSQNVVVVTVNYRVGVFGFLKYGSTINSNFGILDQQLALKWVQNNIAQFGGDPSKVTIFGESAGAMSVGIHLSAAPDSKPLFRAGIMESNPFGIPYRSPDKAQAYGNAFVKTIGCNTDYEAVNVTCIKGKSVADVLTASLNYKNILSLITMNGLVDVLPWAPIVDGTVIEQEPIVAISKGKLTKPTIMGINRDEGTLFEHYLTFAGDNMTCLEYNGIIDVMFGSYASDIKQEPRYKCNSKTASTQMSSLITDYIFLCGNMNALKNAAKTNQNMFAYGFEVVPSFNMNPTVTECSYQTCHEAELPFVFNSAVDTGHTFTSSEQVVANMMGQFWANFAKNLTPNGGSSPSWPAFSNNSSVFLFQGNSQGAVTGVTYPICTNFWDSIGYNLGGVTSN